MRNADVPIEQKLQFFCPFVLQSLRPSDILVLVTTTFLSMTTSMKGTPHQRCLWPIYIYINLQLVWLIFYRDLCRQFSQFTKNKKLCLIIWITVWNWRLSAIDWGITRLRILKPFITIIKKNKLHLNNRRHPQTYRVDLNPVLQNKKDAPGVNFFHIDLNLDLARYVDLDLDLVDLIKTPEGYWSIYLKLLQLDLAIYKVYSEYCEAIII